MYPFCLSMTFTRVPAAIDNAIGDYALTTQAGWTAFGKSLNSGNIAAAQTALGDYTQSLTASNFSMSTPTRPSDQFTSDLKQMGDALSSGDLSTAQSIFATATAHINDVHRLLPSAQQPAQPRQRRPIA